MVAVLTDYKGNPIANATVSVSYTHLDVYKRQVITTVAFSPSMISLDVMLRLESSLSTVNVKLFLKYVKMNIKKKRKM